MFNIFQYDPYDDSAYYVHLVLVAATPVVFVIHVYNTFICSCLFLYFRISGIDWKGGSRDGRMHILSYKSRVPPCANMLECPLGMNYVWQEDPYPIFCQMSVAKFRPSTAAESLGLLLGRVWNRSLEHGKD